MQLQLQIQQQHLHLLSNPKKKPKLQQIPLICIIQTQYQLGRALTLKLPHGQVQTPVYMPVGTKGTMKGLTSKQMEQLGCQILLANTYHLAHRPGEKFMKAVGGLHKFMNWNRNILTDSGGFQMFSLQQLCQVTEDGITFQSPYDNSIIKIRPQDSIHIQNKIGSDIMMVLDDVVRPISQYPIIQSAMQRTIRWSTRCITANLNPTTQNLFPICQGGIDSQLRKKHLIQIIQQQGNGYAIGGLSGGQSKSNFFQIIKLCCQYLPKNKPRYLMGVGYPVDIALCFALGVDMLDCVFPTRTARFGTAFSSFGELKIKNSSFAKDFRPLEEGCECEACRYYTRAYLHMIEKEDTFCHLLSMHNINFNFSLTKRLRKAFFEKKVEEFFENFLNNMFKEDGKIPSWVRVALQLANLKVNLNLPFFETQK